MLRRVRFDEREQDFYEALYTQACCHSFELVTPEGLVSCTSGLLVACIARTHTTHAHTHSMPPASTPLHSQSRAAFGAYVSEGTLLNNYAHIFDLLIRTALLARTRKSAHAAHAHTRLQHPSHHPCSALSSSLLSHPALPSLNRHCLTSGLRQAVDHPYLVVHSASAAADATDAALAAADAAAIGGSAAHVAAARATLALPAGVSHGAAAGGSCADDGSCGLCHDPREDGVAAACGHAFCRTCVAEYVESVDKVRLVLFSEHLRAHATFPAYLCYGLWLIVEHGALHTCCSAMQRTPYVLLVLHCVCLDVCVCVFV